MPFFRVQNNEYRISKACDPKILKNKGRTNNNHLSSFIFHHSSGFTLVEILVAITLISLVSVLAIPNLRKYSEDQILTDTTNDLVRVLKQAQSSAMSGIKCSNGASIDWRVNFSSSNYKLLCSYNNPDGLAATPENFFDKTTSGVTISCTGGSGIIFKGNEVTSNCTLSAQNKYEITVAKTGVPSKLITIDKGGSISSN